ncbi:unnamed protein product [Diabrotica balteata]|uniref:Uncharacterized protein n=1 Tax=Diabrotica balteata TaxID=107213 RepID=A0A9N9SWN1_DIABA|nr:unnamed protein product [Diabrotica balteata]
MYEISTTKLDITVIIERNRKGQGSENIGGYDYFCSGIPKEMRAQQEAFISIRKKLWKCRQTTWQAITKRPIVMCPTIKGQKCTILGVYAVNDDAPVSVKNYFFKNLHL